MGIHTFTGYSISDAASKTMPEVNGIDDLAEIVQMNHSQWLELVASLVFWHENATEESAIENVKRYKKQFSEKIIRTVAELLRERTNLWG